MEALAIIVAMLAVDPNALQAVAAVAAPATGSGLGDVLLNPMNAAISTAAWFIIGGLTKAFAGSRAEKVWARLLPLLPLLVCAGLYFLAAPVGLTFSEKLMMGLMLGALTGHGDKALKQTVRGQDDRINAPPAQ